MMGGVGSMKQWVKHSPPLAGPDHVHFTTKGAEYVGDALKSFWSAMISIRRGRISSKEAVRIIRRNEILSRTGSMPNRFLAMKTRPLFLTLCFAMLGRRAVPEQNVPNMISRVSTATGSRCSPTAALSSGCSKRWIPLLPWQGHLQIVHRAAPMCKQAPLREASNNLLSCSPDSTAAGAGISLSRRHQQSEQFLAGHTGSGAQRKHLPIPGSGWA